MSRTKVTGLEVRGLPAEQTSGASQCGEEHNDGGRAQGHAFQMAPKTGSTLTPSLGSEEPEYDLIRLPEEG